MATDSGAPVRDRGGTWPVSYRSQERILLSQQAKYDRNKIPLLWFWRLIKPEEHGGAAPFEPYAETARSQRFYHDPIAVHLYVDDSAREKAAKKGVVQTTDPKAKIAWSRAEARRIGDQFQTEDFPEGLLELPSGDNVYVPRSGDIFLARGMFFYEVETAPIPEFAGLTPIITIWKGTASLLAADSSAPGIPNLPPAPSPVPPEVIVWRRSVG